MVVREGRGPFTVLLCREAKGPKLKSENIELVL